ncbi:MAG: MurR/RpiR family transcriptional regulator [Firmicutes bacterium]|nr:MurR/RpiR family transcriptional regulator [Bacillota bacterium]
MDGNRESPALLTGQGAILAQIEAQADRLSPAEGRVAELLQERPDDFYQWSVTEVAERAEVSEATVIRFAKSLGFSGFQNLKIALARERAALSHALAEVTGEDDWTRAMSHLKSHYMAMLQTTFARFDEEQLKPIVSLIQSARSIILLGVGTSGLAAQVLQYKLLRLRRPSVYHVDSHFQALEAANAQPGDVAIAFSVSGSTRDTVDALTLAREAGATTVAVTHYERSPITQHAHHVVLTAGFDTPVVSGTLLSHVSQLLVVDALYLGLMLADYGGGIGKLEASAEQIARFKKY